MGLGKVILGHGRDLRPCEQYVAHVVVRLSMYYDVRAWCLLVDSAQQKEPGGTVQ